METHTTAMLYPVRVCANGHAFFEAAGSSSVCLIHGCPEKAVVQGHMEVIPVVGVMEGLN